MIDWKRKLTSRKFWLALTSFVAMLIVFFGGSEESAQQLTSLIMAGATVIAYIVAEGLTDMNNPNLNYNVPVEEAVRSAEKQSVEEEETVRWEQKQFVEQSIHALLVGNSTRDKLLKLFEEFEFDIPFSRADIVELFGITTTPANDLLRKLKEASLIESVKGMGKGKYKFIEPKE